MTTLKDIARVVGVSAATVSNALNDNGKTKPELRDRIVAVAREMNYVVNPMAKGLKTQRTSTIGIISEDITAWHMARIIDGIGEYAEERGFSLILDNLRYTQTVQARGEDYYSSLMKYSDKIIDLSELLLRRNVDGIVYIGTHDWELSGLINSIEKPVVYTYCHLVTTSERQTSVNYDDREAACIATKHLLANGHERIAVITGPVQSAPVQKRLRGYKQAMRGSRMIVDPELIALGTDWSLEEGGRCARELLSLSVPPTALFAMSDHLALGAMMAAQDLGFDVPGRISIVGFDDAEFTRYCRPKLTTIRPPIKEMGRKSAEIIIDLINGKGHVRRGGVHLSCTLVERDSVARPRLSSQKS
jgi:LacI family transcriptional regulator